MADLLLSISELRSFLDRNFPQVSGSIELLHLEPMFLRTKFKVTEAHLRPGGTVSGPAMFLVADVSAYIAILSLVGPKALSVTTSCGMDFMRRPKAGADLICDTRVLKLGRALVVTDCLLFSERQSEAVARANMTYSIPPAKAADA